MIPEASHSTPLCPHAPASPLLKLPAELRNRIYAYALSTAPDLLHLDYYVSEGRQQAAFYAAPSELDADEHSSATRKHPPPELNLLKYVCRQLYRETASLELKFNDHIVISSADELKCPPIPPLMRFFQTCAPPRVAWLSTIVLTPGRLPDGSPMHGFSLPPLDDIIQATSLARQHSHITFKYVLPMLCKNFKASTEVLDYAIKIDLAAANILKVAFRGTHLEIAEDPLLTPYREPAPDPERYGLQWRRSGKDSDPLKMLQAPNLRFYPPFAELDEADFFERCGPGLPLVLSTGETLWAAAFRCCSDWIENGM